MRNIHHVARRYCGFYNICQIGLTKTNLSKIILGDIATHDVHIDSIRLGYSLAILRQRKIHQIVIAGLGGTGDTIPI